MKTGIYYDLSNQEYHGGEGVSKSQLDLIGKCPALVKWNAKAPEDEDKKNALIMGTALHCLLLEPQFFDERFAVMPKYDLRTNNGKESAKKFNLENEHKIILLEEEKRKLRLMQESTFAHPAARKLLDMDGHCESSIFWIDDETGLLCKIRPDKIINGKPIIVDVKKTGDMDRFSNSIDEYRYHVQASMYMDGYRQHFGVTPTFIFIVVSESISAGKYPVRVFILDDHDLSVGYELYRNNILTYAHCINSGEWDGVELIKRPEWARRRDE